MNKIRISSSEAALNEAFRKKSHSNDAICITDLKSDTTNIKEWTIKPMRRQSKAKADNVFGYVEIYN